MSNMQAQGCVSTSIEAVVYRADGRVEKLGIISYYHRNPLKRLAMKVSIFCRINVYWRIRRWLHM